MIHNIPPAPGNTYVPVWIDTYFSNSFFYTLPYVLKSDGEEIFRGKAYCAPGEDSIRVKVNKICQNYLSSDITFLGGASTGSVYLPNAAKTFQLYVVGDDDNEVLAWEGKFYWNYDMNKVTYIGDITECINGHYAPGMVKIKSYVDIHGVEVSWYKKDGNFGQYNTEACGDYAIYYLNRNGGWASFLIEGKVKESDDYDRSYLERNADQTLYYSREREIYNTSIEHTWELSTSWLSDEESRKLAYNLLSSPKVYVHNLKTDTITPGNIVNSSTEYKTFANNRKLVSYTINVVDANKYQIL